MVLCWSLGWFTSCNASSLLLSGVGHFLHWNAEMPLDPPWESCWHMMLRWEAQVGSHLTWSVAGIVDLSHSAISPSDPGLGIHQLSPVSPWPVHCDRSSLLASCWPALPFPFRVLMVTQLPSFHLETKGDWENQMPGSARLTKLPCLSHGRCWPHDGQPPGNCVGCLPGSLLWKLPKWTRAQVLRSSESLLTCPVYLLCPETFRHSACFLPLPPWSHPPECLGLEVVGLLLYLPPYHIFSLSIASNLIV